MDSGGLQPQPLLRAAPAGQEPLRRHGRRLPGRCPPIHRLPRAPRPRARGGDPRCLEAFIAELLTSRSAATASTRYKQLQALYRWPEDEEEIVVNPMARMKPPMVPDKPIPVVPEDALRRRPHHLPAGDWRPPRRGRRPAGR